eukprot:6184209-Prymnesium_polylepis.1
MPDIDCTLASPVASPRCVARSVPPRHTSMNAWDDVWRQDAFIMERGPGGTMNAWEPEIAQISALAAALAPANPAAVMGILTTCRQMLDAEYLSCSQASAVPPTPQAQPTRAPAAASVHTPGWPPSNYYGS